MYINQQNSQISVIQLYFLFFLCKITNNRLIKEAKKRQNNRFVLRAKTKTKAMWQIIDREIGNSIHLDYKTDLRNGNRIISNLQNVLDRLNSFYVESVDNLLNLKNNHINVHTSQQKIDYCPNTMFIYPVTEYEVGSVTQSSKGN